MTGLDKEVREAPYGLLGIYPDPHSAGATSYRAYVVVDDGRMVEIPGAWNEPERAAAAADVGELVLGREPRNFRMVRLLEDTFTPCLAKAWETIAWAIASEVSSIEQCAEILARPNLFRAPSGIGTAPSRAPSLSLH